MIVFRSLTTDLEAALSDEVLAYVAAHRQTHRLSKEAGGQLFGKVSDRAFIVLRASGPRPTDRRSRTGYYPDPASEQREIDEMYEVGLHYLGTWHTHPQNRPSPSSKDFRTMGNIFNESKHSLPGFLMLVVGTDDAPQGLDLKIVREYSSETLQVVRNELPQASQQATPFFDALFSRSSGTAS